jgi:hypothetical protein
MKKYEVLIARYVGRRERSGGGTGRLCLTRKRMGQMLLCNSFKQRAMSDRNSCTDALQRMLGGAMTRTIGHQGK